MRMLITAGAAIVVAGCSYNVSTPVSPAFNVYSSYSEKIPGNWVVIVSADGLSHQVKVDGFTCSAHDFPMDLGPSFQASVRQTLQQVFENVEASSSMISKEAMRERNVAGQILVRPDTFNTRLNFNPGFWSATAMASIDLSAGVTIDGQDGRLLGTSVGASRTAQADGGGACEGGSKALADAASVTMRDLMERLAERVSNTPKVREAGNVKPLAQLVPDRNR